MENSWKNYPPPRRIASRDPRRRFVRANFITNFITNSRGGDVIGRCEVLSRVQSWRVSHLAGRAETISAQMIYLVTELRLEGGWKRFRLWSRHYGWTCGNRVMAYHRYSWAGALLVSERVLFLSQKFVIGTEKKTFLSFFKREIRFATRNHECNIDIERRGIRTRSRKNISRRWFLEKIRTAYETIRDSR